MQNALISIKPQYANQILAGQKSIEIRKKSVRCSAGASLWIYVTRPTAAVLGVVSVKYVEIDAPDSIWEQYKQHLGISEKAYFEYTNGRETVSAIHLTQVRVLEDPCTLRKLRKLQDGFHPPQYLRYMNGECPILELLTLHVKMGVNCISH